MFLEIQNITKRFGNTLALSDLSFQVPQQSIFGLLGPNGAGKTSLLRIITQIIKADQGSVLMNGSPLCDKHKADIGYMPEERGLYDALKVGEQITYFARLRGMSGPESLRAAHHWTDHFGIGDWWNQRIEQLSKGMQQKVQFIATVIHNPQFLIFDEPFTGLDPINTALLKQEIESLRERGCTILLSTHHMGQVEEMCNEIVLVDHGKRVLTGSVESIKRRFMQRAFRVRFRGSLPDIQSTDAKILTSSSEAMTVQLEEGTSASTFLTKLMQTSEVAGFEEIVPSLNDIFVSEVAKSRAVP